MAIDWAEFIKNRSEIPPEALEKYMGQWIAWSPDGTHIVAASANRMRKCYGCSKKRASTPPNTSWGTSTTWEPFRSRFAP